VARTMQWHFTQSVIWRKMECSIRKCDGISANLCDILSSYDTRPAVSQLTKH